MDQNSETRIKKIHNRLRWEFSVIAIIWVAVFGVAFYYYTHEINGILRSEQEARANAIVESFSSSLKGPLVTGNLSAIEELSLRLAEQFDDATVSVFGASGENLISVSNRYDGVILSYANGMTALALSGPETRIQDSGITTAAPVQINNSTIGYVELQSLNSDYERIYSAIIMRLSLLLFSLLFVGFCIYFFLANRLSKNIVRSLSRFHDEGRRDALTNLPNRAAIYDYLKEKTEDYGIEPSVFSICFIDVNKLKVVNDTLGHAAGDQLIRETARRLSEALRSNDFLGRLAGDEFIVVLNGIGDPKSLQPIISRMNTTVNQDFAFEGAQLKPSISVGVSVFPDHGKTVNELIRAADQAMYDLKHDTENKNLAFKVYDG